MFFLLFLADRRPFYCMSKIDKLIQIIYLDVHEQVEQPPFRRFP